MKTSTLPKRIATVTASAVLVLALAACNDDDTPDSDDTSDPAPVEEEDEDLPTDDDIDEDDEGDENDVEPEPVEDDGDVDTEPAAEEPRTEEFVADKVLEFYALMSDGEERAEPARDLVTAHMQEHNPGQHISERSEEEQEEIVDLYREYLDEGFDYVDLSDATMEEQITIGGKLAFVESNTLNLLEHGAEFGLTAEDVTIDGDNASIATEDLLRVPAPEDMEFVDDFNIETPPLEMRYVDGEWLFTKETILSSLW